MFVQSLGALSLASRIKLLSDRLYAEVDGVYRARAAPIESRWFVFLRLLQERGPLSTTEIATAVGTTHPAVSQLAPKLEARGLIVRKRDRHDDRRTLLSLTPQGRRQLDELAPLWEAMRESVATAIERSGHDLLAALDAFEAQLASVEIGRDMLQRHARRAVDAIRIEPFRPELREDFYRLNVAWLIKEFAIEPEDQRVLSQPQREILDHGGRIFFAVLGREVIGTCALEREAPGVYAVIKMTVAEPYRGLGIGRVLLERTIQEFHGLRGRRLFLETNSKLKPAITLYEAMGFVRQSKPRANTPFERADVYMIYEPGKRQSRPPARKQRARSSSRSA
jgi:DNA-binding MarR family transcriptional regulator/N-acetylglutamate synthase-like GNAT family acetyltransferase